MLKTILYITTILTLVSCSIKSNTETITSNNIYIRIFKEEKVLEVWSILNDKYYLNKTYPICKISGKLGPKVREGDRQVPEGHYFITKNSLNPNSKYTLSMDINYPNEYDQSLGRTGSYIMIHGSCCSVGCVAMGNNQIIDIYNRVSKSLAFNSRVNVDIYPFKLTNNNLNRFKDAIWYPFWLTMKDSYSRVGL